MDTGGRTRAASSSVPEFGAWDGKSETNYSVVFTQAREKRKKNRNVTVRHSLGDERELLNKNPDYARLPLPAQRTGKKREKEKKKKKKKRTMVKCFSWLFKS